MIHLHAVRAHEGGFIAGVLQNQDIECCKPESCESTRSISSIALMPTAACVVVTPTTLISPVPYTYL